MPRFNDVAESSGVEFTHFSDTVPDRYFLLEIMGSGVAWIDFDLDGQLDLYFANGCVVRKDPEDTVADEAQPANQLFRNLGANGFRQVASPAAAGDQGYGQGVAVADIDADGFPDLFIANYGANTLLLNNGDGTFQDVTARAGVGDEQWASSAIWLDINGDDYLDLYVVNYLNVTFENSKVCSYSEKPGYCGPGDYEGVQDLVYVSQGDGTFVESAEQLGFTASNGKGLAVIALDLDDDLRPEIYVANDMSPNFLFSRSKPLGAGEATSAFVNVAATAGCAVSDDGEYEASMGISCADFDCDGRVDIFLTHFHAAKNTVYRNLGDLVFVDDSRRTRAAATSFEMTGFGTLPLDYDRDGAMDLFISNGHVLGATQTPNKMRAQLLRNNGHGRFSDISDVSGAYFQEPVLGRSVAGGDYDNDGDIDIAVLHLDRPAALLRNDTQSDHPFIAFQLETPSRMPPVGGRIVIKGGEYPLVLPVSSGGSYLAAPDRRIIVGLGRHAGPVDVEVHWPSGRIDSFESLQADRYWRIVEGFSPETI
jgi:hypothetical protein